MIKKLMIWGLCGRITEDNQLAQHYLGTDLSQGIWILSCAEALELPHVVKAVLKKYKKVNKQKAKFQRISMKLNKCVPSS
jgi:hypothetical protein